jgi:hypothetical protein
MIGVPPVTQITCPTFEISLYPNHVQLETRSLAASRTPAVGAPW